MMVVDDKDLSDLRASAAAGHGPIRADVVVALVDNYRAMLAERDVLFDALDVPIMQRHSLAYATGRVDALIAFEQRIREAAR